MNTENLEAYKRCLALCKEEDWRAVYNALLEDGYTDKCNFVDLLNRWVERTSNVKADDNQT